MFASWAEVVGEECQQFIHERAIIVDPREQVREADNWRNTTHRDTRAGPQLYWLGVLKRSPASPGAVYHQSGKCLQLWRALSSRPGVVFRRSCGWIHIDGEEPECLVGGTRWLLRGGECLVELALPEDVGSEDILTLWSRTTKISVAGSRRRVHHGDPREASRIRLRELAGSCVRYG